MKLTGYSNKEMSLLRMAHQTAMESECRQRVGAIVVKGGSVLARASNRDYNHPTVLEESKVREHASICAERRALAQVSDEAAKGATVVVVRAARQDDGYVCSKPCSRCQKVMKALGVKKCIYIS